MRVLWVPVYHPLLPAPLSLVGQWENHALAVEVFAAAMPIPDTCRGTLGSSPGLWSLCFLVKRAATEILTSRAGSPTVVT